MYRKATSSKFPLGLNQQIKPVNNKIKFRDNPLLLKIVGQKAHIIISQSRFSAALRMPDNALSDSTVQFVPNGFSRKNLRIAHNMLLNAFGLLHISNRILQDKSQPIFTKQ